MKLLADLGHPVTERQIARDELYIADEMFMCGTAAEVTPVREIDNRTVGEGVKGPITATLQGLFFAVVRGERPEYSEWLHPIG